MISVTAGGGGEVGLAQVVWDGDADQLVVTLSTGDVVRWALPAGLEEPPDLLPVTYDHATRTLAVTLSNGVTFRRAVPDNAVRAWTLADGLPLTDASLRMDGSRAVT